MSLLLRTRTLWPTAAALALAFGALRAADAPQMKEGYWSIHSVSTDQPGNKKTEGNSTICRNHAYDDHVREVAKKTAAAGHCKTIRDTTSGGVIETENECTIAGRVIHTKGTVNILSDSSAHSESHTTYTPPMGEATGSTMVMDQKYIGACPAGVAPGDILAADGKKMTSWKH